MDKKELQARKEELQKHLEQTQDEVNKLEQQIAEVSKPKLRHGDYGYRGGERFLYVNNDKDRDLAHYVKTYCSNFTKNQHCDAFGGYTVLGNIFDDLKALQEDVKEFRVSTGMRVKITPDGRLSLSCTSVSSESIDGFILGIRQIHATDKRQKSKE